MPPSSIFRSARRSPPSEPELAGIADEDLMLRSQQGDASAFEVVFDRHADAAFSLARRMGGRRATAEDIVQEAFLSFWRSGARYDPTRGTVRSWVLGVVHHRAVDALNDLPDEQRHVIVLAYVGGYTHSEIAAMLQIPGGTVKGRMRLGMKKLQLSLGMFVGAES
jgi:RNA polymerase sigma-70 factor (ECF subfamily)